MKRYVAILDTVQPIRRHKTVTLPLGPHQDAEAAIDHFAKRRRKERPETPTIVICAEEERDRFAAILAGEQGDRPC